MNTRPTFPQIERAFSEGRARPVLMSLEDLAAHMRHANRAIYEPPSFSAEIAADLKAQRDRLERNRARKLRIAEREAARRGFDTRGVRVAS